MLRRRWITRAGIVVAVATTIVTGMPDANAEGDEPVTFEWVTVGAPGNAPDTEVMAADRTTGYGDVAYEFEIGQFLVTNEQSQSASPWGAYDMGGNLFQWTDTLSYAVVGQYHAGGYVADVQDALYGVTGNPFADGVGPVGVLRGTDFGDGAAFMAANGRTNDFTFHKWETYGIRLVRLAE